MRDGKVFPVSSIQISIKRGKVFRIFVENLYDACPGENYRPGRIKMDIDTDEEKDEGGSDLAPTPNTYCSIPTCTGEAVKQRDCDFKLFVSWLGSDINHKKLISTSERFMIYSSYNLDVLFKTILKIGKPTADDGEREKEKVQVLTDPLRELEEDVRKRITERKEVVIQDVKQMTEI